MEFVEIQAKAECAEFQGTQCVEKTSAEAVDDEDFGAEKSVGDVAQSGYEPHTIAVPLEKDERWPIATTAVAWARRRH